MRFIVSPLEGAWRWELIDGATGQVHCHGAKMETPRLARIDAENFRRMVHLAPIEMGT